MCFSLLRFIRAKIGCSLLLNRRFPVMHHGARACSEKSRVLVLQKVDPFHFSQLSLLSEIRGIITQTHCFLTDLITQDIIFCCCLYTAMHRLFSGEICFRVNPFLGYYEIKQVDTEYAIDCIPRIFCSRAMRSSSFLVLSSRE